MMDSIDRLAERLGSMDRLRLEGALEKLSSLLAEADRRRAIHKAPSEPGSNHPIVT